MLGKKYPVLFDFEEHRKRMTESSLSLWRQYRRQQKERNQ